MSPYYHSNYPLGENTDEAPTEDTARFTNDAVSDIPPQGAQDDKTSLESLSQCNQDECLSQESQPQINQDDCLSTENPSNSPAQSSPDATNNNICS